MTVRGVATPLPLRQPLRVVFDHMGELSPQAKVLQGGALVYCSDHVAVGLPGNVEVVRLPDPSNPGKIDLAATMQDLGARGINELHVEAGARLMGPLIAAGLVDELLVYLAPKLLGRDAREMFSLPEPDKLAEAMQFDLHDVTRVGDDIRVLLRSK